MSLTEQDTWDWILTDFNPVKVQQVKLLRKINQMLENPEKAKKLKKLLNEK